MPFLETLIVQYGYLAVLVGTFFEGETILALGGIAAHERYLHLGFVIAAGFLGSFAGDQLWFHLGRTHGRRWLSARPGLSARLNRVCHLLDRNPTLFILGFRFIYGVRNIAPVAIALSSVTYRRFVALNIVAAAIWASAVGVGGYWFGDAIDLFLTDMKVWEGRGLVVLTVAAGLYAVWRMLWNWASRTDD